MANSSLAIFVALCMVSAAFATQTADFIYEGCMDNEKTEACNEKVCFGFKGDKFDLHCVKEKV